MDLDFGTVVQVLIAGISTGSTYALVGLGLVLVLTTTGVPNFAHGEIGLFATFIAFTAVTASGQAGATAAVIAISVGAASAALCGGLVSRLLELGNPSNRSLIATAVLTLGLFFLFHALTVQVWGPSIRRFPSIFGNGVIRVGGASLAIERLGIIIVALVSAGVLAAWLKYSRTGISSRATVQNAVGATLSGVPVRRLRTGAWMIGTSLSGLAGVLIAPIAYLSPNLMASVLIYGFAAATLGGLSSLSGTFVGGLVLGVVQSITSVFVSGELAGAVGLVVLLLVLLIRPAGLMGRAYVVKV